MDPKLMITNRFLKHGFRKWCNKVPIEVFGSRCYVPEKADIWSTGVAWLGSPVGNFLVLVEQ